MIEILFLGLIGWGIYVAVQRRSNRSPSEIGPEFSLRRLFVYLILFATTMVAAIGLTGLIGELFSSAAARQEASLAGPLAMTIVGVPVLVTLASWVRRTHAEDPDERRSIAWSLYVNAALVTTLSVTVGFAFAVSSNLIDSDWRGETVAGLIVWAAAWAAHWTVWKRLTPEALPRLHIWAGSIIGSWVGAISAGIVVNGLVERVFEAGSSIVAAQSTPSDLWLPVAGVVIGSAVWAWHWLVHGLAAERTEGWHLTVLLFGILAGLIAGVASAGYGLYLTLEWLVGDPGTASAATHFVQLSAPIAGAVVGLSVWRYYRTVLGPNARRERTELDRVYDYLVSVVGLGTVAVAVAVLVLAFFASISSAAASEGGGNTLIAAVTLLAVGAPVWGVAWRRVQRLAATDDDEVRAPARRTYLFGLFGVGGIVAFGSLIGLMVVIFEALLGERGGRGLAADLDVPVALLVTTGVVAAYHWIVYRAERHVEAPARRRDVLFVGNGSIAAHDLEERTNTRVRVLHRLDLAEGTHIDMDSLVAAIDAAEGEHLLVVAGADSFQVMPFE